MKIAPKKPHFFKPIMPGFKRGLKIPIGFLRYLKGLKHIKHAILRRASKKWLVKVNCWRLEDGWKKFAKEHDLQLGDLLVFRHEGRMEFKVSIFDSSHCDREYAEYLREEEESNIIEETSKKVKFKEAAIHNPCGQSRFECIVRPYCVSNGYLRLPRQFARANGLMNKKLGVIIRDERQRSWNLRLATYGLNVHIYNGWDDFCVVNNIKEGDYMTFEVVANGEKPIWKFRLIKDLRHKALDMTTPISQIPASASADANPHFISTIKHYTFTKAILYLPKGFTKSNGMMDKHEMILVDEKQRSWTVWLGKMDPRHFGIKSGWPQFRKANGVQVGDTYMFELTDNGTIPIMHVHYMKEPTVDVMASLSCSAPIEKA
ncbi:B3 domain-containing protein REM10-like [Capsicum chacoense]